MSFFKIESTKKSTTSTHRSPSPRWKTPNNKTENKKIKIEEPKREGLAQKIKKQIQKFIKNEYCGYAFEDGIKSRF